MSEVSHAFVVKKQDWHFGILSSDHILMQTQQQQRNGLLPKPLQSKRD
jgi:hypothetical protein